MQEAGHIMCDYWCIWSDGKTVHFEIFDQKMYFKDASAHISGANACEMPVAERGNICLSANFISWTQVWKDFFVTRCRWQYICIFLNVFVICICDEYGWLAGCTWQCREEGNGFLSVPLMDLWPLSSSLLFIIARCCFVFKMYLLPRCRMYFSPQRLFGVLLILQVFSVTYSHSHLIQVTIRVE